MEQTTMGPVKNYYLKGNWRHVFWGLIVFLVLSYIGQAFVSMNLAQLIVNQNTNRIILIFGLEQLVIGACWIFFYLAYGLNIRVRLFKVLLIIRAALQIFWMLKDSFGNAFMQYYLSANGASNLITFITIVVYSMLNIFDIVFFVIVASSKQSNGVLKSGCIFSLLVALLVMAYTIAMVFFANPIAQMFGMNNFGVVLSISSIIITVLKWASTGLFFGAVSYSRICD